MDELPELVTRARARLEQQALYPEPLREDACVVVWPWFFRLPHLRRYSAYAFIRRIALRASVDELIASRGRGWLEDLLVHELCHVWQHQHHPVRMFVALIRYRYDENPFELEARAAAAYLGAVGR